MLDHSGRTELHVAEATDAPRFGLTAAEVEPALEALALHGGVLAMITGIDGAFYRPLGAVMAFPDGAKPIGRLSSGCIEGDLAIHAQAVRQENRSRSLRYGRGSPFVDIRLPCGSGIDVTLVPVESGAFDATLRTISARRHAVLALPGLPSLEIRPDPRMAVFGTGPEAETFAELARAAGYPVERLERPETARIDAETAVVLFFHDHEREPDILRTALRSPAFWIGAQGSRTAQTRRLDLLRDEGWDAEALARLRGPIGLIKGTRDPRVLAVSVLAEIVEAATAPDRPSPSRPRCV
ncbi:XdhC family protein [Limimaricola sp. G21655-S1]|uniref:XdhC family protein n=1 Tax=Limimaricola sp. G21655-S1 TaxID=3014768 RepID=UPI0022B00DBC|nr:XdhC family protein [Limimaricola sp. G21655-S1]